MKQIKLISAILLIATVISGLNACKEDDKGNDSLIVGKWKVMASGSHSEDWLQFTSDMKFEYKHTNWGYSEYGIYKIEGDVLYMMFSDEDDWFIYKIKELTSTSLILQEQGSNSTEEYLRME